MLRLVFQFPQSERTNCNYLPLRFVPSAVTLSVSTIGTNELQLVLFLLLFIPLPAFSFHNRNERTATGTPRMTTQAMSPLSVSTIGTNELQQDTMTHEQAKEFALSVSTIGTNELQPNSEKFLNFAAMSFQFPQSERTNCNGPGTLCPTHLAAPFSFHNRNERTATRRLRMRLRRAIWPFSFHNRNERTATYYNSCWRIR